MRITRREFLKAAAALTAATVEFSRVEKALAGVGQPPVIWLQGQGCSGCSVSFLNSVYYATVDSLLLNTISLEYHSTVMASAGDFAVSAASITEPSQTELVSFAQNWLATNQDEPVFDLNLDNNVNWLDYALMAKRGYILIVEGAIPTGSEGLFCTVGANMTMLDALKKFSQYANTIIAIGTCACYGGVSGGSPNLTSAKGVKDALTYLGISKPVINIPGCPVHPDWLVGTLSYLLVNGAAPPLDSEGRPVAYFGTLVHDQCVNRPLYDAQYEPNLAHGGGISCLSCHMNTDGLVSNPRTLGSAGCLFALNCKGKYTYADCPMRKWNSPGGGQYGVNWCIGANAPCQGCTQPNFPDGMEPFYTLNGPGI